VSSQASIIPLCTRLPLNGILVDVRLLYKTDGARLSTVRIIWWIPPDASGRGSAARLGRCISRPYSRTPSDCPPDPDVIFYVLSELAQGRKPELKDELLHWH
jgi:hypothetical protein